MAARKLRVVLDYCGNKEHRCIWTCVDTLILRNVSDFLEHVRKKLDIASSEHIELYVKDCLLPVDETIDILRDDDIVSVRISVPVFMLDGETLQTRSNLELNGEELPVKRKKRERKRQERDVVNSCPDESFGNDIGDAFSPSAIPDESFHTPEGERSIRTKSKKPKIRPGSADVSMVRVESSLQTQAESSINSFLEHSTKKASGDANQIELLPNSFENSAETEQNVPKKRRRRRRRKSKTKEKTENNAERSCTPEDFKPPNPVLKGIIPLPNKHIIFNERKDSKTVETTHFSESSWSEVHVNSYSKNAYNSRQSVKSSSELKGLPLVIGSSESSSEAEANDSSGNGSSLKQNIKNNNETVDSVNMAIGSSDRLQTQLMCSTTKMTASKLKADAILQMTPSISKSNERLTFPTNSTMNNAIHIESNSPSKAPLLSTAKPKSMEDYSSFPPLKGPPRPGDVIAYKILQLSDNYTPEISPYKKGNVLDFNTSTGEMQVELDSPEVLGPRVGKFEITEDEDEDNVSVVAEKVVRVNWAMMIEPRLLL